MKFKLVIKKCFFLKQYYVVIGLCFVMHVPYIVLLFVFEPTNAQIYFTTLSLYILFTATCFDISVSSSGS